MDKTPLVDTIEAVRAAWMARRCTLDTWTAVLPAWMVYHIRADISESQGTRPDQVTNQDILENVRRAAQRVGYPPPDEIAWVNDWNARPTEWRDQLREAFRATPGSPTGLVGMDAARHSADAAARWAPRVYFT